jgi:hypothetical protein
MSPSEPESRTSPLIRSLSGPEEVAAYLRDARTGHVNEHLSAALQCLVGRLPEMPVQERQRALRIPVQDDAAEVQDSSSVRIMVRPFFIIIIQASSPHPRRLWRHPLV